jgi:hypothetical protein
MSIALEPCLRIFLLILNFNPKNPKILKNLNGNGMANKRILETAI